MTEPITLSVTIQGTYSVTPEQAEQAYASTVPATIAALDQKAYDDGNASVLDVVSWIEDSPIDVSVSASTAKADEDNRVFVDHVLHAIMEFNYAGYGADDVPVYDNVDGGPSEMARDLAQFIAGIVSGYFAQRAYQFKQAPDDDTASHVIARVLKNLAGEMSASRSTQDKPAP